MAMSKGNELAQRKPKWWMVGVSEGDGLLPKQHASTMVEHASDDVVFMDERWAITRAQEDAYSRKTWQTGGVLRF